LIGGAQEDHRRAGTLNVVGALALAEAVEITAQRRLQEQAGLLELRELLERAVLELPGSNLLGQEAPRSPHISSWLFAGVRAEPLLVLLDLEGISASSGSACSSHSIEPSRVVVAMGFSPEEARGLIRFSLGHATTRSDIERLLAVLPSAVGRARLA
jgi:cysteine desulfurase